VEEIQAAGHRRTGGALPAGLLALADEVIE
jgi:hypothetical protein